ncbi:membrane protein insertase YidC [Roseococcus sp. SDR]|uniref:membrane protein insertase YidC n=1 Tax=Roseococcus sp. SDR TaxID=2835532 RepID=UPI001BCBB8D9|nr:membrane protein insertase YidC [Roseococcus sp. SDR]MBS7791889.1 membrane protein insertase YidC [Roseococcus sp. SDR]MBV1847203.1 membrane protein insertase YidC [Roseococcus sp. SDR]
MDQKRLLAAIALSIGILLTFEVYNRSQNPAPVTPPPAASTAAVPLPSTPATPGGAAAPAAVTAAPAAAPAQMVAVENPRVQGRISARGLMLESLILKDYRETIERNSPLVTLLAPRNTPEGYFAQWGWTAADGRTRVPDNDTDWTVTGGPLTATNPVTFTWDNGQGQVFQALLSLDANYMFHMQQRVVNNAAEPVQLLPWARIRRERTPQVAGFFILHEGFIAVQDGRLTEITYSDGKKEQTGPRRAQGSAWDNEAAEGWAGLSDKYWLTALTRADDGTRLRSAFRHIQDGPVDRWQVDVAPPAPVTIAPNATDVLATRLFAGAKEVRLLDDYATRLRIQDFDKAIDFGWFYFITKPFFYGLDWLFLLTGNMGVAIIIFTLVLKIAFFPLANKAYKSMSRMRLLAPKMTEIRERYKEDPQKMQAEMMALYKTEKINPASGCLPILIQIPVFFALYKVLFVTIEMRHAPFFGWIRDLSAPDPTNFFNLFGLIPFDPPTFLHLPAWAIAMGLTMYFQQKLNPQPPDPIQQKIFQWMPVIFTFMLASFPAGLVIYWTWNNLLSIGQQWYIMRLDAKAQAAKPPSQGGTGGAVAAKK